MEVYFRMPGVDDACLSLDHAETLKGVKQRLGKEWRTGEWLDFLEVEGGEDVLIGDSPIMTGDTVNVGLSTKGRAVLELAAHGVRFPLLKADFQRAVSLQDGSVIDSMIAACGGPNNSFFHRAVERCLDAGFLTSAIIFTQKIQVTPATLEYCMSHRNIEAYKVAVPVVQRLPRGVVNKQVQHGHIEIISAALECGWAVPRHMDLKYSRRAIEKTGVLLASGLCPKDADFTLHCTGIQTVRPLTEAFIVNKLPSGLSLDLQRNDLSCVSEADWTAFFSALSEVRTPGISIDMRFNNLEGKYDFEAPHRLFRSGKMPPAFLLFAS